MRFRLQLVLAFSLLALTLSARAADPVWIQLTSPNFILFTDTNETKGRRLLEDFETRLGALDELLGDIPERQFPIEVFLFSKKEDFLEAAPRPSGPDAPQEFEKSAYLWRGPDRVFVAARDKSPNDIADDVGHALGHAFFERLALWRPFWLEEAAAEHFRNVRRNPDNRRVKDGYPVSEIFDLVPSRKYDDEVGSAPFRLQAHRLLRIVAAEHRPALQEYLKALHTDEGAEAKLDVGVESLQARLDAYTETAINPPAGTFDIKLASATPATIAIHRGDLLVAAKKTSEAAAWYNADSPEARGARAILARFSRSGGEPIRVLARATSDLPDAGLVLFHFGSIETKAPEDLELQARALARAAELLPRLGRVRGQLARVQTLTGKSEQALEELDRALELEPEYADGFSLIRAEALLALNRYGDANRAAAMGAALPHLDKSVDYDFKSSEMARHIEEVRRDVEGRRVEQIRREVEALAKQRDPAPPPPPPPPPPERFGKIDYNVQAARQINIVDAPLPVYANALVQKGAAGDITVRVTIGADGKVTQAAIVSSQLQEMNNATLAAARKWTFKVPAGAAPLQARIVFRFSIQ
jgi:TonB family protein